MAMTGYCKLFGSIVASTIWDQDKDTKILWITLLALSGADGRVEGSVPGLAHLARIGVAETEASLKKLLSPDPYSRSKEHEGRRIAEVDGGWLILNRAKYREKMNSDERREYRAKWMRDKRSREQGVNTREQTCTVLTQSESESESESKKRANTKPSSELKSSSDKEALTRHPIGIKKQATSKLLLDFGMAGYKAKTLCQDALEAYVHCHKCSFIEAVDGLVSSWRKYDASSPLFKKGIVRFLEEGAWKTPEVCSADEARRHLDEITKRVHENRLLRGRTSGAGESGGDCKICDNTGLRDHKGHPGRQFFCHCEFGKREQDRGVAAD